MKVFHCDHCGQLVFFENTQCVNCAHLLAYLPEQADVASMELVDTQYWRSGGDHGEGERWRLCANYVQNNICNWAIPEDDPNPLCRSCRLTHIIPDVSDLRRKAAWCRLETAKRRLLYTLFDLNLPVHGQIEDPEHGLTFDFLSDDPNGCVALSGHDNGRIVINIAEADDSERERRRNDLHEPYRTLLGHFRHEIGHYYWDRLVAESDHLEPFRALFGDERQDYGQALNQHYQQGPLSDWQKSFVSAYASCHPWEDWAETWAHYLHMRDALETAAVSGLTLKPRDRDLPAVSLDKPAVVVSSFERMIDAWFPLTYVINNLNRGLGLADGYPFVLSVPVIEKLRFIHHLIAESNAVDHPADCQNSARPKVPATSDPPVVAAATVRPTAKSN